MGSAPACCSKRLSSFVVEIRSGSCRDGFFFECAVIQEKHVHVVEHWSAKDLSFCRPFLAPLSCLCSIPLWAMPPPPGWHQACQINGCLFEAEEPEWSGKRHCWRCLAGEKCKDAGTRMIDLAYSCRFIISF